MHLPESEDSRGYDWRNHIFGCGGDQYYEVCSSRRSTLIQPPHLCGLRQEASSNLMPRPIPALSRLDDAYFDHNSEPIAFQFTFCAPSFSTHNLWGGMHSPCFTQYPQGGSACYIRGASHLHDLGETRLRSFLGGESTGMPKPRRLNREAQDSRGPFAMFHR